MSGAADASKTLRAALAEPLRAVGGAVSQARAAQAELRDADDLILLMGAAAHVALACEALHRAAQEAESAARTALSASMASTGASTVHAGAHTLSLREVARKAIVTDPAAVPTELYTRPEPRPDLTEIGKRLRAGEIVPGCVLPNGAASTVQIKVRQQ